MSAPAGRVISDETRARHHNYPSDGAVQHALSVQPHRDGKTFGLSILVRLFSTRGFRRFVKIKSKIKINGFLVPIQRL
jgi:hypothetical protein